MNPLGRLLQRKPSRSDSLRSPFGPDGLEIEPRVVRVDGVSCATFAVAGYPRDVRAGWLDPLLSVAAAIDVSVFIEPMDAQLAASRLQRQLARLESSRRVDANHGRLLDPNVDAAAGDAASLARQIARGDSRLFRVGITICVRGRDDAELDGAVSRIMALLSSLLAELRPMTFRSFDGWLSTLPLGIDRTGVRRTFDTPALAATFPFPPGELSDASGVLYGRNERGPGLVFWDRFAQDNHNSVILARSGSGKSYLAKLEILRSLYRGIDVAVVDPEDEYRLLAKEVDGTYLHLGSTDVRLNPFDLGPSDDALTRQALFLHGLVAVLLGTELSNDDKASLDRAIIAAYAQCGITSDQRTHRRPVPTMASLTALLNVDGATVLARRLEPFVTGSYKRLFDGPTTVRPSGHLVVYSLRDLPDELKSAATMMVLDRIWQTVSDPVRRKRRLVTVDEAWLLMRDPHGAKFLFQLAKAARKYWCGLTVITQDAGDLLGTELGRAIVANAATQILLRQAPQAIDGLAHAFKLSEGERTLLLSASPGTGIICAGQARVAFHALASEVEHRTVTTNPAELTANELSADELIASRR